MKTLVPFLITLLLMVLPCHGAIAPPQKKQEAKKEQPAAKQYWINSNSGKTHNRGCRYYANCQGYPSNTGSGNNCKLCGGAGRSGK